MTTSGGRLAWTKRLLLLALLLPAARLIYGVAADNLGADPIETLEHQTGWWALRILLLSLLMTPLQRLSGWAWPIRFRRLLGLTAFFYALAHLGIYALFDQSLSWQAIWEDVVKRPYITVGVVAMLILTPMAATSTDRMIQRLGHRWKQLHRLVYLAAPLALLHVFWQAKTLQQAPWIYAVILTLLLMARLPSWSHRLARFAGAAKR
ncbi:MAG: protein-methionine-sulfoxide reductase heme-binding subunit MsrQ [Pseudomonadota bacterium]|nr:protein-methionine-sulfoxide reductase heme-binding subunit MsrQ [Pseudomonadota bacterium]